MELSFNYLNRNFGKYEIRFSLGIFINSYLMMRNNALSFSFTIVTCNSPLDLWRTWSYYVVWHFTLLASKLSPFSQRCRKVFLIFALDMKLHKAFHHLFDTVAVVKQNPPSHPLKSNHVELGSFFQFHAKLGKSHFRKMK